jgi:tetratricopeptide (TPR) repeat protein
MLNIPKNYPIFLRLNPFFILIIAFLVSLLWLWVFHVRYKAAEKRNKQFLTNFYNVNDSDANDHIAKALSFSKGNAVYYANQGLFFVRNVGRQFEKIVNDSLKITVSDKKKLQMAQEAFEKATELNPDDALFIHNLAWIRYLLGDTIAAMSNFNRTNELDPNIALYHISRGLIFEREGEIKKAVKEYLLAICLSPDIIDSDFFIHLKTCFPEKTDSIGKEAIKCLENKVKQTNNPIFKARLAKLYLSNKQYTKAERLQSNYLT